MSYFFIIFGVILVVASARNTQGDLFTLLQGDFFGSGNFLYWFAAIFIIGAIGYDEKLRPISDGFLALVIIGLLLNNKGFFAQFGTALNQIKGTTTTPIGNASSPGVSLAVDTVPNVTQNTTKTTTTIVAGGGNGGTVVTSGGSGSNNGCPPGLVYSVEVGDCIDPNNPGGGGFGGIGFGGSGDPFGPSDPFGQNLNLLKLPVLTTGHGVV
jgi:hypothetical protein